MVSVPGLANEEVTALWGSSSSDLYVGTLNGKLLHRTAGGTWNSQTLPASGNLGIDWIWGSGPGDVYAEGANVGLLYHTTGDDVWTTVTLPITGATPRGIWGSSATDVYVGLKTSAGYGAIARLGSAGWTQDATNDSAVRRIWGSGPGDVYAIESIFDSLSRSHGDGIWRNEYVGIGNSMVALWGSGATDVYIVTSPYNTSMGPAEIFHSKGDGTWTPDLRIAPYRLTSVGGGAGNVYVGGAHMNSANVSDAASLYRSTGDGQWQPVTDATVAKLLLINCIWGSSATNVYVGGRLINLDGAVLLGTSN